MATTPRYDGNLVMCRMDAGDFDPAHPCNPRSPSDFYYWETNYDEGTDDREANYTFYTTQGASGAYADQPVKHINQVVQSNSVSILWQIPQIVIITAAEILFSITGYEFAYSQSAPSMKALVQALWLLTTAIGDSIIVLITALNLFSNMATEFFAYAGISFDTFHVQ
ncbi:hypothetical protein ANCDUO_00715 [Ancylostoma duodenale]|uniref:Uncharacterized protein n=1 Tax=Ancylostoma duodenale TaxID=51022 RepID=A0A0C2HH45_9BILA|nr:hypothetical protein ANCDUO_00715 [Ancylostoma duodenale]